jgi:hypothetical protein
MSDGTGSLTAPTSPAGLNPFDCREPSRCGIQGQRDDRVVLESHAGRTAGSAALEHTHRVGQRHLRRPTESRSSATAAPRCCPRLQRRMRPLLLRRTKEQVAARPPRQAGAAHRARAEPSPPARLSNISPAGAAESAGSPRRHEEEPLRDLPIAHTPAPGHDE